VLTMLPYRSTVSRGSRAHTSLN